MGGERSEHGFRTPQAADFPPIVIVDVTNVCDLACIHCAHPVIKKLPEYHGGFMEWETWTRIVDEVSRHAVQVLRVTGDGEPILHRRLPEMLAYAKAKGVAPLDLTTNANRLTPALSEAILRSGVDAIDISMDAVTAERYEAIRVNGRFDQLMANVDALLAARTRLGAKTKILVSIVDQPENHDQVQAFVAKWEPRVDKVLVRLEQNQLGLAVKGTRPMPTPARWPCPQLWNRVTINHAGKLRFCVIDWMGKSEIGDLATHSIEELWKSGPYAEMRKRHLEGREREHALCGPCTDWSTMRWDYGWDRVMREVLEPPAVGSKA